MATSTKYRPAYLPGTDTNLTGLAREPTHSKDGSQTSSKVGDWSWRLVKLNKFHAKDLAKSLYSPTLNFSKQKIHCFMQYGLA